MKIFFHIWNLKLLKNLCRFNKQINGTIIFVPSKSSLNSINAQITTYDESSLVGENGYLISHFMAIYAERRSIHNVFKYQINESSKTSNYSWYNLLSKSFLVSSLDSLIHPGWHRIYCRLNFESLVRNHSAVCKWVLLYRTMLS